MRKVRALFFLILPLAGFAALAQQPQQPPPPPEPEARIVVPVERVTVPLVVRDMRGEFIYDLERGEVTVLDNGVPQQIRTFELATEPLSVVILVDTSQRVAPLLGRVRESGILFSSYILGQSGEAALITFDSYVNLRQDFTTDTDELLQAFQKIQAGGSQTRLADAFDQAVGLLRKRPRDRRRVVVILSEALNEGSTTPVGQPLRWMQLEEISVYAVALSALEADLRRRPEDSPVRSSPYPPGVFTRPGTPGQPQTPTTVAQEQYSRANLLAALTTLVRTMRDVVGQDVLELYAYGTGGLHHSTFGRAALEDVLKGIGQDLHNQYVITYQPSNREQMGFHRIEVQVNRSGVSVRHRPGYYLGAIL